MSVYRNATGWVRTLVKHAAAMGGEQERRLVPKWPHKAIAETEQGAPDVGMSAFAAGRQDTMQTLVLEVHSQLQC